jgi:prophage regulatory protein
MQQTINILRLTLLRKKVGLGTSSIYQMMAEGRFPRPRKIGKRAVGWLESDIDQWLLSRCVSPQRGRAESK